MRGTRRLCILGLVLLAMVVTLPPGASARVMMVGSVNQFAFGVTPNAFFTVDDWLTNPNLWTLTISNSGGDNKTVGYMIMRYRISSGKFGLIAEGSLRVVGPSKSFKQQLLPGETFVVTNTMVQNGKEQVDNGSWSQSFVDEVLRIGYLPEGVYTLGFSLEGRYNDLTQFGSANDPLLNLEEQITVRNPSPPELITPRETADDVVAVPRFTWSRPQINDYSGVSSLANTRVVVNYTVRLWKMFDETGAQLSEEDAIGRIPIWTVSGLSTEAVDFNPNDAREELISGRRYCWQVQAFDGTGRYISEKNQGKSEVWDFTIQFTAPELNDPQSFNPLVATWRPARAAGQQLSYRVRVADNAGFSSAYQVTDIPMTQFTYPDDGPALRQGTTYYLEVQATDARNLPLGAPSVISFRMPAMTAEPSSPADGETIPGRAPTFTWTGNSSYAVITLRASSGNWSAKSPAVQGGRWIYDGEPLVRGGAYSWQVTPTNQNGDPVGNPSQAWKFTAPGSNQITLGSPVNETIEVLLPRFTWDAVGEGSVSYTLTISDDAGTAVHTAQVSGTEYTYPADATPLKFAAKYTWRVIATVGGVAIESPAAWFTTPFIVVEGQEVTIEDIGRALQVVMAGFPEYEKFKDKILVGISDGGNTLTPSGLLELLSAYKILKVTTR